MPRKEAKSKSLASWFIFLVILMLMWAAFDDITTGREPVYTGEYWKEISPRALLSRNNMKVRSLCSFA